MADMTEREFAEKFMNDKAFKREVVAAVMDYEGDENSEHAMGEWLAACGETMGYHFDVEVLDREVSAQIEKLSGLQKIMFLGSFINAGRKSKKAREKAEKKAAKEAAKEAAKNA